VKSYLKLTTSGIPLSGQAVKHRQLPTLECHFRSTICHPYKGPEIQLRSHWSFCIHKLFFILDEAKLFDHFIKMNIPAFLEANLLQPINGLFKLAYFFSIFRIDKTFRLYHIHILTKISIQESHFDIHLPYLIVIKWGNS
jgi:hypothetical protein